MPQKSTLGPNTIRRFWEKVNVRGPDECWEWTAASLRGYGKLKLPRSRKLMYAHRLSWVLENGNIPKGMLVCHTCDNPPCVNPGHLFLATQTGNMADARRKGRIPRGECKPNTSLKDAEVGEVRKIWDNWSGMRHGLIKRMAKAYKVDRRIMGDNVHRRAWDHLL